MSNASSGADVARSDDPSTQPRAIVHKQVLEAARENPDASVADLAATVTGASPDLVERVLEEYGDPGIDSESSADPGIDSESSADGDDDSAPSDVTPDAPPDAGSDAAGNGTSNSGSPSESPSGSGSPSESPSGSGSPSESPSGSGTARDGASSHGDLADADHGTEADDESLPDADELDEKQLAVLRAIRERPTATQKELAASLGVSRATVSKRVNRIDGFEWSRRADFVDRLVEGNVLQPGNDDRAGNHDRAASNSRPAAGTGGGTVGGGLEATVRSLSERVERVESRLESGSGTSHPLLGDPELAHKVVHACLRSDRVSETEELRILRAILGDDGDRTGRAEPTNQS